MNDVPEPVKRVTLTTPLIHTKVHSKRFAERYVTKGYYLNVPQKVVQNMKLREGELIEIVLKRPK